MVNTASILGLISTPDLGIYQATKHGVVTLSETLYHQLVGQNTNVKVSVLCPGTVDTRIVDAARNHPNALRTDMAMARLSPAEEAARQKLLRVYENGMASREVADHVFRAIREDRFYILTDPNIKPRVQMRMEDILQERNPTNP